MQSKPEDLPRASAQSPEFAEPIARKPLVLLKDTERSLRVKTVDAISPLLPEKLAINLGEASVIADESLEQLAEIDLDEITDADLKPARVQMGMLFVGFGALAMAFLLMVLYVLHPEMTVSDQIHHYWHQYIWFVCLGISGLFMVGREAMRPVDSLEEEADEPDHW
ncbi:hypothetical protein OsccyDRAFT_4191 [Leptolyngbyaceae cyanobacterium JSC-12]|nr:hypothetical protein OsccyDRAFT_4191 [Leptolyngbyaceae cyanobacterium JSC-12]